MPVKKEARSLATGVPAQQRPTLPTEELLAFLRQMLRIRRLEERSAQAYGQGKIGGFCHLYIGQEAIAVGALAATRPDDYVFTTYRDHGMALVRGISPEAIFAELLGRVDGCSKGRGVKKTLPSQAWLFLEYHALVRHPIDFGQSGRTLPEHHPCG